MFLKKLKLAGFKSFVDPTTLTFPGKLSAVVGPNGSGKSNIIDAVSWVLGENSMKYLRGDVLTDVIFNGSTARKPVGQASIELIFDNQDAAIGGEYAQYAEISIKRLITRDSDSTYYLNNSPCRRRDILDIFSGTGLGPRSYSIIGQNMVSRIIESKPDDMRAYLEEAAGISKYKERRRETELRIQHTKDNLSRVNDLRSELERQLTQLKRQAADAERYKSLKEQERIVKSQWHAIQWRQLDAQLVEYTLTIQQEDTALEGYQSELIEVEIALDQRKSEQKTASEAFQEVQRRYYAVGNEIARIEQDLVYQQERQQQWTNDLNQVETEQQEASQQQEAIQDELEDLTQELTSLVPQWEESIENAKKAVFIFAQAENAAQTLQSQWDSFYQQTMKSNQQVGVEQARIQHLQQKLQTLKNQQNKIRGEQQQLNFAEIDNEIQLYSTQLQEAESQVAQYAQELNTVKDNLASLHAERQQAITSLDELRSELQILRGQQASIAALQQAALGQHDQPALKWLAQHTLDKRPRLAQGIEVEEGWELAAEKALGPYLQAVCVEELNLITSKIKDFTEGQLLAFAQQPQLDILPASSTVNAPRLLDKINSHLPIQALIADVYLAETLEDALELLAHLKMQESVITRQGIWLSPAWLKISYEKDPQTGIFQREQELKKLQTSIFSLETKHTELTALQTQQQAVLQELESKRDKLQHTIQQQHARSAELAAQTKAKQEKLIDLKQKAESLDKEQEELLAEEQQTLQLLEEAKGKWQHAQTEKEKVDHERENLAIQRDQMRQDLQKARENADSAKEQAHQLEIRVQSVKSQQGASKQALERIQMQLNLLMNKQASLSKELEEVQPLENLKSTLSRTLDKHVTIESELNTARISMEVLEQELDKLDKQRHTVEQNINRVRNHLENLRLDSQSLKLKAETLQEQIKEQQYTLEEILKELPPGDLKAEEWQAEYERITQRIHRLGSINLIAVEEYATCQERKEYLDKQFDDLQTSLTTLEDAIAKIDRETRARFKEVYDLINQRFQELFPVVFGGGHATLELTDENILEAGVAVMACPPGKRNSSINLLSGGEKTMTALALIFSIFHLNPSPLCLLDEVDAALDDMNVARFCDLVKKMANKTQFIFISHNKLAIEMAEHLIGITMHEPGVSRLVSVDVQEAISLASA